MFPSSSAKAESCRLNWRMVSMSGRPMEGRWSETDWEAVVSLSIMERHKELENAEKK